MSRPRKMPRSASSSPLMMVLTWVAVCLPPMRLGGFDFDALLYMGAITLPPFGLFLSVSLLTRCAAQKRLGPAISGRVLGCLLASVVGVAGSFLSTDGVADSHSSTAPLGLLLIPVIWGGAGGLVLVMSWLIGLAIEIGAGSTATPWRRRAKLLLTLGALLLCVGSAGYAVELHFHHQALLIAAQDPQTAPHQLQSLRLTGDFDIRSALARNPSTPPGLLRDLGADHIFRDELAGNPSTPPEVLATLASDPDFPAYRLCDLAENPATPVSVLRDLARQVELNHCAPSIRYCLLRNPHTPSDAVRQMTAIPPPRPQ